MINLLEEVAVFPLLFCNILIFECWKRHAFLRFPFNGETYSFHLDSSLFELLYFPTIYSKHS